MNTFKYQNLKNKNYFEGWYLRITDEAKNVNLAFIFAITKDENDPHSFIQILNGSSNKSKYYRFETSDFSFLKNCVYIKDNFLSMESMYLKTDDLEVSIIIDDPENIKSKSAMSFLVKFPLDCFQEVNLIDGFFNGEIIRNDETTYISGKTYIEKTYGNKFPKRWIWIQSNHFNKDAALTFAHGMIPILWGHVRGFFAILKHNGKEYRFASYNFSKLKIINRTKSHLEIVIKKRRYKLILVAKQIEPVKLVGPSENGVMNLDVYESINSLVTLTFTKGKKVIIDTLGRNVGFENMYD